MSEKYKHLFSPIKVGNVVFKNRLTTSPSNPYFVQGSEPYPTEAAMVHYVNKARNGAALVTFIRMPNVPVKPEKNFAFGGGGYVKYRPTIYSRPDMELFNSLESYFSQATEAVHLCGSKASIWIGIDVSPQYDIAGGLPRRGMPGQMSRAF